MAAPLMPKATAVWLVENTTLTFDQIAEFCGLHILEVQAIADGEVATGMVGLDPLASGQITKEELAKALADPNVRIQMAKHDRPVPLTRSRGPRYTPVAKRQDRPDAIAWLVRTHPELQDSQIAKLVGSTKSTIQSIRTRTHWNASNLKPQDPVTLGLCSSKDLNEALDKARRKAAREASAKQKAAAGAGPAPKPAVDPSEAEQPDV